MIKEEKGIYYTINNEVDNYLSTHLYDDVSIIATNVMNSKIYIVFNTNS